MPDSAEASRRLETLRDWSPCYFRWAEQNPGLATPVLENPPVITTEWLNARFRALEGGPGQSKEAFYRSLRLLKHEAMLSVVVQDQCGLVTLEKYPVVLAQISRIGEFCVDQATLWALAETEREYGAPVYPNFEGKPERAQFCVLGLGKLGAGELNFSSDVDLIFLHSTTTGDAVDGATRKTPAEYFSRAGQLLSRALSERDENGFVFRVDLNLRPEGRAGPVVLPLDSMADYYEIYSATWEKAAMAKARPVGGNRALGAIFLRQLQPVIYRRYLDFAAVASIRQMKIKIEDKESQTNHTTVSVKLDEGGIRDLEFFVQGLSLLYGGKHPDLRTASAVEGLGQLVQHKLIGTPEKDRLLEAYLFLRRTENHLQMVEEEQVYNLPPDPAALARLARSLGFEGPDDSVRQEFTAELADHMAMVRRSYNSLFAEAPADSRLHQRLRTQFNIATLNPDVEGQLSTLAKRLEGEISRSADVEMAHTNLEQLMDTVGRRISFWGTLLDNPALCERLVSVFGSSDFLSKILIRNWRLIGSILTVESTNDSSSIEDLRAGFQRLKAKHAADATPEAVDESEINCLRLFRNLYTLEVGMLDLAGDIDTTEASRRLTCIARVCLEEALKLAWKDATNRHGNPYEESSGKPARFAILGMGKLGAYEISYGSDLDVIFLFSEQGETKTKKDGQKKVSNIEFFIRVAQRLISYLTVKTAEGSCYEVDARLRPSGNAGLLVTDVQQFRDYHHRSSQTWEKQALLKGRCCAGDEAFGRQIEEDSKAILRETKTGNLAQEIAHLRGRMERELAKEDTNHKNPKTGRGGVVDIEYTTQFLQLKHFGEHGDRLWVSGTLDALVRLNELGLIPDDDARALMRGYDFIQRLSSRLRIVQDRPIKDIDLERTELDALAYRMGYSGGGRTEARRRLMDDYRHHTEAVRDVYLRTLGVTGNE